MSDKALAALVSDPDLRDRIASRLKQRRATVALTKSHLKIILRAFDRSGFDAVPTAREMIVGLIDHIEDQDD